MNEREKIARTLTNHPVADLTENALVLEDPLGVHKPLKADDGAKLDFTKKDLANTVDSLKNNVHFFQKTMLRLKRKEFELGPKQLQLIESCQKNQFTIGVFNRQGGKSTGLSVLDVHDLCFQEDEEAIIYAPILNQTEIIFGKIRDFVMNSELLWSYVNQKGGFKNGYIRMLNGNDITVMSASDQSHIRGFSPTKIQIDESQDIQDFKYYEDILPSGATTDAKIQETGTPMGRNHFYHTWRGDEFKKVKQVWHECPFTSATYVEMMRKKLPKKSFDQEFLCVWDLDEGAVWEKEVLDKILTAQSFETPSDDAIYYAGVDVGKSPARTVLSVWRQRESGKFKQSYLRVFYENNYKDILRELQEEVEIWHPSKTCVDRTGVGDPIADLMDDMIDGIEPIFYTSGQKQSMVDKFTLFAEDEGIELIDDEDQKKQFMNWQRKRLTTGRFQYKHPPGELDDIVNANILAAEAVDEDGGRFHYRLGKSTGGINNGQYTTAQRLNQNI